MSEIKQIAEAYGLSYHSVKKWSKSKRHEATRNLQAGVNPIIAELVGELQRECYVASCHTKLAITFEAFYGGSRPMFSVYYIKPSDITLTYIAGCTTPLKPMELQAAIDKVRSLYK